MNDRLLGGHSSRCLIHNVVRVSECKFPQSIKCERIINLETNKLRKIILYSRACKVHMSNGVWIRWTYRYQFDHRSQATCGLQLVLGNDPREYAWCCWKMFPHLVAWVRVGRGKTHVKSFNSTPRFVIPKNKSVNKNI
jgi:hypothetical protein